MTQTFEECDDFLLGRDILVASVVEEGQRQRRVWLPANETGWYDFYTHEWFCGGQWIVRDAPLEKLPLLVRAGGLPLSARIRHVSATADDTRELKLFPVKGTGRSTGCCLKMTVRAGVIRTGMPCGWNGNGVRRDSINLKIGDYRPAWPALKVSLPAGEGRKLLINGEARSEWVL
jgi:alpha-glucosidase